MTRRSSKKSSFIEAATFPARNIIAQLLITCILLQTLAPAAFASPATARPASPSEGLLTSRVMATAHGFVGGVNTLAANVLAFVNAALTPQENWSVVLTPVTTEFHDHTGLDYHQPSKKLVLSANYPGGVPNSFELIAADGGHSGFSNVAGLNGEVLVAAARDDGQGPSPGGFNAGELLTSTGVPGVVARISADGASVQNPWVILPDETGHIAGLHVDRTGVFGGDLVVVTTSGGVWRVNSAAVPTRLAMLNTRLAGVAVVPDDAERYGPWAGKAIVGAKDQASVYAIDPQGAADSLQIGINPQDIDIVPAHENFYALDFESRKLWGAAEGAFAGIIGDILVAQESPGVLSRVRWDGSSFAVTQVAETAALKQVTFSPAGANPIPAVKQVYDKIAVVRHAPQLNSGRVEGTLWQLLAEDVELNGNDVITSDLLVPGTPSVSASNANYIGTIEGTEDPQPSGHTVSISGNASLRHVVTRTNPIELEPVPSPPAPAGTRNVSLSKAGETFGDAATLRNLSLSGKAGVVAVPPGTYGQFSASSHTAFVFGVANSAQPTVYNLEDLSLSGGSELRLNGPVILTVKNSVTLSGSTIGATADPRRLVLRISGTTTANADNGVKLSGSSVLYGIVRAPQRDITITGNGRLRGTVSCDYLFVNGNGVLQITENDIPPPPVNRPPTVDAGPDHTITLPTNATTLDGSASDDGLPTGSTLGVSWKKVSGPGPVTFTDAQGAATSATFTEPGEYVLRLTASDGQLSSSDTTTVTVIPRNQPPTVDAGEAQTIELPAPAELRGAVADDALPRGSTVTATWSVVEGPGAVTFADPHAAATSASFNAPGTYTLRLSANDMEFTVSDDVVITVLKNEPPIVNAGADQEIALPNTAILNGTASDDGLPRGSTLEVSWSQVSGPAAVIFYDAFAATTTAIFTAPGTYVLRLTGSDSQLSASDNVTVIVKPQPFTSRTYTLDADFSEGDTISLSRDVPNQLQLDDTTQTFNFIWVAVSSKGTVVKINTETGAVIGEYSTSPAGQPKDPSRTTVDQNGNIWATNRDGNSVVHIGLVENGQCVDRNNNGIIDTSTGFGDIRAWPNTGGANTNGGVTLAQDECIIHYTKVNSFGTRHVSVNKDNDIWVSGTSGRRFDLIDGKTGGIKRAEPSVNFGGYGGLIDRNNVIWSARNMLRWDTSKPLTGANGVNWRGYNHDSYGLCIDSTGNVWNTSYGNGNIRKFAPDGTLIGTFNQGSPWAQGCVVDRNDHVWIAHSLNRNTVGHMRNDGSYVGTITVGSGPTGVAVDGAGKIWATNHDSRTVSRIDPALGPLAADGVTRVGAVDFTTRNLGGLLYNYSDMTGSTLSGAPGTGTWSTVFDTQLAGAEWGRIGWTAQVCGDGLLTVSVASSENGTTFGPAETITNGADPTVANGRYLKVSVSFKRASSGESPILYDLSVGTSGYTLPTPPNAAPSAFAGADQTMTLPDAAKLSGVACDDGFPRGNPLAVAWSKVSGPGLAIFTKVNSTATDVAFTLPGDYVLRLTASDGDHSVSDEVTITALPANMAPIVNAGANQTITLPNTLVLNGTVSDDGLPTGGTLSTFWSQLGGPGIVNFDDAGSPVTRAVFPVAGTYTLRFAGNDSHRVGTDDVVITVNASPALNGATLALVAGNVGPYVTGTMQPLRATLKNSAGNPLANYGVEFEVTGPNSTTGSAVTDASGVATFNYSGTNEGTDTVRALVRNTATATINSNAVSMVWTFTAVSPPAVQGWIGGPLNGSTVTGIVPVTVGAGINLTQGTVEYWPASNPAAVTVLASEVQGGPGATLATFDTTVLANGNYVISLRGVDSTGKELVSQVTVTVAGENKPGRVTLSFTDLTVPLTGIPITIERQYDSLERNHSGDFGYGWSLDMSGPRLEVSPDNDVTLTDPVSGRRVTFNFNPTSFGFPFSFFYQPAYTPEPGVYGKLTSNGCGMLIKSNGQAVCFLSSEPTYRPTAYTYTDPYGRVYTLTAAGKLQSIKNIDGNLLTFSPSGITSSAGNLSVAFTRDAQGRIEQITDPTGKVYRYTYDAAGDLTSAKLPDSQTPFTYEYDPGHFFRKGTDARGNVETATTYYPNGRLQSVTDAMGKTTGYAYDLATNTTTVTHPDNTGSTVQRFDPNGMLLSETDPMNRTRSYTYDANRNKRTETDALGKTTLYDYDAGGHLKSVKDPLNKTTSYVNNQFGQPVSTTDPLNKVRTLRYDDDSNLSSVSDEHGTYVAFTWNDRGSPLSIADGDGKTTRFTYDAYGNVLSKTDPLERTTSYTYDAMGRVMTATDARGVSRYTYDALGRLLTVIDTLSQKTEYEYDGNGNRTLEVDTRQQRTVYEYDAANRLSKTIHPDGMTVAVTYNFRGQKVKETINGGAAGGGFGALAATASAPQDDPERTTEYVYDNAGQLVKIILPDDSEINFTYDEVGRIKTATDERGKTLTYEYDPLCGCDDRLTKIVDANGKATTYTYDDAGRRTSFIDANNRETRYEYDSRDNVLKLIYPDNTTVTNTFDGMGRVLTTTDQEGRVARFTYDGVGNILSVIDAKNQTTQHSYDSQDNLLSTIDAKGSTTRYEYDALNRLIKRVLPLGMSELYTYDQVGNLATRNDYRGKQTSYEYDSMNRLLAKRPDATLGEPAATFSYTVTGERRTMTDASGTTNYTYDIRDRLLTKQTPQGTLSYTYDPTGNLTSMRSSNADGVSVDYTYDDLNRLEQVVDNRLGSATTTAYAYDPVGNLKSNARPNGVRDDYIYNTRNLLTNLNTSRTGTNQASYSYMLDRTGRRISATEHTGRTVTYTYDALYKLTREAVSNDPNPAKNGTVDYTLDSVGNRLSRISTLAGVLNATSSYDANNRLTSDAYDANGNTRSADGRTFTYDFENRVRSVNGSAVRVTYHGDGNLAAKTAGGVTTKYLVDDLNPTGYSQVIEEVVGGQVERQYTYGNAIISQRQRSGSSWAASFYSTDGHGSVRQLTDSAGAITDTYDYDAFGKLISQTGTTPNAYLFAGERFDADLGLYHFRARSYDADRGRFTSVDPFPGFIDEPLSLHKYLYANADPVNFIDPSGLVAISEYGALVKRIALRTVAALRTLGRAIACVFLYVASWVASVAGYAPWAAVRAVARRMRLSFCVCKISRTTGSTIRDNNRKGKDFENALEDFYRALGYEVQPQASRSTPFGRRYVDIVISKGGSTRGIEAKVGNSPYTAAQRRKDGWLNRNGTFPTDVRRFPQWRCRR